MIAGLLTSHIWFVNPKVLPYLPVPKVLVTGAPGRWAFPLQPPETADNQCRLSVVKSATRHFQLDAPLLRCGARRTCGKELLEMKLDKRGSVYWMLRKLKKPTEIARSTTQRMKPGTPPIGRRSALVIRAVALCVLIASIKFG